jgi:hypothetical protein
MVEDSGAVEAVAGFEVVEEALPGDGQGILCAGGAEVGGTRPVAAFGGNPAESGVWTLAIFGLVQILAS